MKTRFACTFTIMIASSMLTAILLTSCNTRTTSPSITERPPEETSAPAQEAGPTATSLPATATPVPALEESQEDVTASLTSAAPTPTEAEPAEPSQTAEATTVPTATVEATATTPPESPPAEVATSCTDIAAFFKDVTVEDYTFFNQKESFVKTWQVRNEGTCTWSPAYTINFDSGFTLEAPQTSPLPVAAPGQTVEISLQMTAPERGGQYISRWRFKNEDGEVFGVGLEKGQLFTIINVGFVNPGNDPNPAAPQLPGGGTENAPDPSPGGNASTPDPAAGSAACAYSLDPSFGQQVIAVINQARQQAGLNRLNSQSQLAAAAEVHSIDLACTDGYDHIGSDGSVWTERVARQGYANYNSARENIRVGNPDFGFSPQYVFDRWFESQIHHDNMYYPSVSEIGLSCVLNPDSEYKEFCTAVFARP
jgi:uncharacterized protein YkwD